MSSNLAAAVAAIEAEIAHARNGYAHFYARIEALEKTIAHLVTVDGGVLDTKPFTATPVAKSKAKGKAVAAKPVKSTKAAKSAKLTNAEVVATTVKPAKTAKGGKELPFTGGDYWTDLVTVEPKSSSEILDAAIGKLEFQPTKEHKQKLAGRMSFALSALVKAGKVKDSGTGRARRFFKA